MHIMKCCELRTQGRIHYFLRNLQMDVIAIHKAGKACQGQTLELFEPIHKFMKKMKCCEYGPRPPFSSNEKSVLECLLSHRERERKSYRRGRCSTVDLLVLAILDQLLFKLNLLFTFLTKQATLIRWSTVVILPLQLVFPTIGDMLTHWQLMGHLHWQ